jgi:hypothetical protein
MERRNADDAFETVREATVLLDKAQSRKEKVKEIAKVKIKDLQRTQRLLTVQLAEAADTISTMRTDSQEDEDDAAASIAAPAAANVSSMFEGARARPGSGAESDGGEHGGPRRGAPKVGTQRLVRFAEAGAELVRKDSSTAEHGSPSGTIPPSPGILRKPKTTLTAPELVPTPPPPPTAILTVPPLAHQPSARSVGSSVHTSAVSQSPNTRAKRKKERAAPPGSPSASQRRAILENELRKSALGVDRTGTAPSANPTTHA